MNQILQTTLVLAIMAITGTDCQLVGAPAFPPAGINFQQGNGFRWAYNCNYENRNTIFGRYKSNVVPCSEQCLSTPWCIYFTVDHQFNCYLQNDGILRPTTAYRSCGYMTSRGSWNGGISGGIHFSGHIRNDHIGTGHLGGHHSTGSAFNP